MDEVDVHPVNLSLELRQRVQPRLTLAPVVVAGPIVREFLARGQLHTLRSICGQLTGRPTRCNNSSAQLDECLFRNVHTERTDGTDGIFFDGGHGWLLSLWDRTCSRPALLSQDAGPESTSRPCGALVHPLDMRWGGSANRMRPFSCCPRAGTVWLLLVTGTVHPRGGPVRHLGATEIARCQPFETGTSVPKSESRSNMCKTTTFSHDRGRGYECLS